MGALKWLRVLGSNQLHQSQSLRYKPLYQPSIEMAAISDSRGTRSSYAAMLIWLSYLESESQVPVSGGRRIQLLLRHLGFTLYCQSGGSVAQGDTDHKWWTRPVTLRSLLNAIEVFYY